jgi:hypothetical protein
MSLGTYDDPELLDRADVDLSALRKHVRADHAHRAARGIPRANLDLALWHARQHHRFHGSHFHAGIWVLIRDRFGRRPNVPMPRPLGWYTGQHRVSRSAVAR